jgi:hypothetical protein
MRLSVRALIAGLLLGLAPQLVRAAPDPSPTPVRRAAPTVEFEDAALPAAQREALGKAAKLVATWAMVQNVVQAVAKGSAVPADRVQAVDEAWRRGEDPEGLVTSIAGNECSLALQRAISANPSYADAYVTDARGAVVCMTARADSFVHAGEQPFARAFAEGSGSIFVAKAGADAGGLQVVQIAVPVRSAGQVIGVLVAARLASNG